MPETQTEPQVSSLIVDEGADRVRPTSPASRPKPWWIALVVAAVAAGGFLYWRLQQVPATAPPAPAPTETPPAPATKAPPAVRYPIEDTKARAGIAETEKAPAVPLAESDAPLREALSSLIGANA